MLPLSVLSGGVLAVSTAFLISRLFNKKPSAPLPPGPKPLPLIGNLLDMPKEQEWITFTRWGKQYGGLVSVCVLGQHYLIVNSAKTAVEMLDKKSRIYSDRPIMPMGGELVGWKDFLALLQYGPRFRSYRKMFHQVIGTPGAMTKYNDVIEKETIRFLKGVLATPDDFFAHIKRNAGATILRITYGYEVQETEDPFVSLADAATDQFSVSTSPTLFLVNMVPALRHLPDWFPGAGFKKTAQEWRRTMIDMVESPFQFVKREMANGTAQPSAVAELLKDEENLSAQGISDIKFSAASFYSGGSDTTVSTVYAFFKAMLLFPEVQAQAQAEIDAVIGNNRLPTIEDRDRLPYISALIMEAFRWYVVAPIGVPHRVGEEDIHDNYLIPKDTIIIPNIWYMARDPTVYKNPEKFDPTRFMRTKDYEPELDPRSIIFGFGRRICPGRALADVSVFITCAMTLAVFNIKPHIENGKPVMPDLEQTSGIISHPSQFRCSIEPRSPSALSLIKAGN